MVLHFILIVAIVAILVVIDIVVVLNVPFWMVCLVSNRLKEVWCLEDAFLLWLDGVSVVQVGQCWWYCCGNAVVDTAGAVAVTVAVVDWCCWKRRRSRSYCVACCTATSTAAAASQGRGWRCSLDSSCIVWKTKRFRKEGHGGSLIISACDTILLISLSNAISIEAGPQALRCADCFFHARHGCWFLLWVNQSFSQPPPFLFALNWWLNKKTSQNQILEDFLESFLNINTTFNIWMNQSLMTQELNLKIQSVKLPFFLST